MSKDRKNEVGLGRSLRNVPTPFADAAFDYWHQGYSPIPVEGKQPRVTNWPSYSAPNSRPSKERMGEWAREFGGMNIGLVLGGKIGEDHRLAVVDIDDDRFTGVLEAILGKGLIVKYGAKGASAFVRAEEGVETCKLASTHIGHVGDILCNKSQVVIPPSIHPTTGESYTWGDRSLLEVERTELPAFTARQLGLLKVIVQSEHTPTILGGTGTHDATLRLAAQCVRFGDNAEILRVISSLFPSGYPGNTLDELPGMIEDARRKDFDSPVLSQSYDPGDIGPQPLGYTPQNTFVFFMPRSRLVMAMSAQQLTTPAGLLGLANKDFWEERFPKLGPKGEPAGFAPQWAADVLMQACRDRGPFNMDRVRGRGVWRDGSDIIVNLTGRVPEESKNVYVCFDPVDFDGGDYEVDANRILEAISLPNWKNTDDPLLLLGWMFLAPICGVLKSRPHGFLIGARNTGKTTLLNGITRLLSPLVVSLDGQSTEAGIRQRLQADSLPVILDEFESDGSRGRLSSVMKLARSAYSSESQVARGTPEGKALQFNIRASFLFAAIHPTILTSADASRIIRFELDRHDNDPNTGRMFNQAMDEFEALGPAWCQNAIRLAGLVPEAVSTFLGEMPPEDSRHLNNMSTMFAGAFLALEGRVPSQAEAALWIERYFDLIQIHAEAHRIDDADDCLNHLLGTLIDEYTVGSILATVLATGAGHNSPPSVTDLLNRGVKVVDDGFVVANRHPGLAEIYRNTRWENGSWRDALARIDGARPQEPLRFNGPRSRGIWLPKEILDGIDPIGRDYNF
ncbi:bifunctional DNA primase/polymerase [Thalassospiraceae bacterium LMO-JJ14]|nr:bifunctional DNA primase/polymerase [Thalassospiraceae bacterium LMO-JJ14]